MSRERSSGRRDRILLAGLAILVSVGCVLLQASAPYYFLWDDNATYYLPVYALNGEAVAQGELAHVNYRQYLGAPHLAAGQSGVLYPPVYLASAAAELFWDDPRPVIDLLASMHLIAAAIFVFLLLRELGARRRESFLGALLWVSFPFVAAVSRSWIFVSYAAALLPANLWLLERMLRKPDAARILAFAAAKALFVLQGYVQYAVLAGLFEVLWIVGRKTSREDFSFAEARAYVASLLAGAAIAAPMAFPMLWAKQISAYRATSLEYDELISNALEIGTLLRAQFGRMDEQAIHLTSGAIFYLGLPILALAILGGLRLKSRVAVVVGTVAVILSTEAWGIFYSAPLLSSFRWPFKGFLVALLYFTVAAALAASERRGRWTTGLLVAGVLGNVLILTQSAWTQPFGPNRVDRDVAEVRAEVAEQIDPEAGRAVSLWMNPAEPRIDRLLAFNFATLARAYHLGGYDPLISAEHLALAKNLEFSNIFRYALTRESLDYLSSWSVRYLLVPKRDEYRPMFERFPELRLRYQDDVREVWENFAAEPFVRVLDAPQAPSTKGSTKIDWEFSGFTIRSSEGAEIGGEIVRVAVAPMPWYSATARTAAGEADVVLDWDAQRRMMLKVPPGTRSIEVDWINVPFQIGLFVCLSFLGAVGVIALRRRSRRENR